MVLDKTLESPLDSKEIQPVHPKGNQSWIFIGRTDAEAEIPILWPHGAKTWLFETPGITAHQGSLSITNSEVHLNSCGSSQWCHPAISSSVVPFSSCPQSLPASESQSTGASALASFLPKKSQGWSPSEWTGWISLQSKGLSRVLSNTVLQKHQFFSTQLSSGPTLASIRDYWKSRDILCRLKSV